MGTCCSQEFKLKQFGLNYDDPEHFVTPKGTSKSIRILFLVHRVFWCIYHIVWIILSGAMNYGWAKHSTDQVKWFIYLTNWSYFLLTINTIYQMYIALHYYFKYGDSENIYNNKMPPHLKVGWVLYNIASPVGFLVTILFWGLIYNGTSSVHVVDIHTHGVNSVYILLDVFIIATPVRLLHFIQPMIVGITYVVFSIIYEASGGLNSLGKPYIYSVLDWIYPNSTSPGWAILYAAGACFVGVPLLQLLMFGLYSLREYLSKKFCGGGGTVEYNGYEMTK